MHFWKLIELSTDVTLGYHATAGSAKEQACGYPPDRRTRVAAILVDIPLDKANVLDWLRTAQPHEYEVGPALTFTRRGGMVKTTAEDL